MKKGKKSAPPAGATVTGYLRLSLRRFLHDTNLAELSVQAQTDRVNDGLRKIINDMLPHLGISDSIGPTEKPADGVRRRRAAATNPAQTKALDDCLRWLTLLFIPISSTPTTTTIDAG
jgi:hypothetical protein